MKKNNIIEMYKQVNEIHKSKAYLYISEMLQEAKEQHNRDFRGKHFDKSWGELVKHLVQHIIENEFFGLYEIENSKLGKKSVHVISDILNKVREIHKKILSNYFPKKDIEQSWKPIKGKLLEKFIKHFIENEIIDLGIKVIDGNTLEKTIGKNLTEELGMVKRNLAVDYGKYGFHLPDVDIIIYKPKNGEVVAILSIKATLRERIAQTGYWKIKLAADKITKNIKVYFVSLDEDGTLTIKSPAKKGRAIVETDLDGSYVLSETNIEESDKVKMFDKFIDDLKELIK
jgi:type II restriction enzyme